MTTGTSRRAGLTLVELLVAITLLGILLGAVAVTVRRLQRTATEQLAVAASDEALRNAEQVLSTLLRTAGANPLAISGANAPGLVPGAPPFTTVQALADFNPPDGDTADPFEDVAVSVQSDTLRIRWQRGGTAEALAFPVRAMTLTYLDENGTVLSTTAAVLASARQVRLRLETPPTSTGQAGLAREVLIPLTAR